MCYDQLTCKTGSLDKDRAKRELKERREETTSLSQPFRSLSL